MIVYYCGESISEDRRQYYCIVYEGLDNFNSVDANIKISLGNPICLYHSATCCCYRQKL